jgi:hypothetical protein
MGAEAPEAAEEGLWLGDGEMEPLQCRWGLNSVVDLLILRPCDGVFGTRSHLEGCGGFCCWSYGGGEFLDFRWNLSGLFFRFVEIF